jgi:KTSC domain
MTTQNKQPTKPAPIITLAPVKSSNIAATGYDAASKTLAVQFKGGGRVYHYADVPESIFTDMSKAESVGKFVVGQVVGKFKHTLQSKAE